MPPAMHTVAEHLTAQPESRGVNMHDRRVIRFGGARYRCLVIHADRVDLIEIDGPGERVIDKAIITDTIRKQLAALWRKAGRA